MLSAVPQAGSAPRPSPDGSGGLRSLKGKPAAPLCPIASHASCSLSSTTAQRNRDLAGLFRRNDDTAQQQETGATPPPQPGEITALTSSCHQVYPGSCTQDSPPTALPIPCRAEGAMPSSDSLQGGGGGGSGGEYPLQSARSSALYDSGFDYIEAKVASRAAASRAFEQNLRAMQREAAAAASASLRSPQGRRHRGGGAQHIGRGGGGTCYFLSGDEVYELPCGLTRSGASEEVVFRRLCFLASERGVAAAAAAATPASASAAPPTAEVAEKDAEKGNTAAPPARCNPRDMLIRSQIERQERERKLHAATVPLRMVCSGNRENRVLRVAGVQQKRARIDAEYEARLGTIQGRDALRQSEELRRLAVRRVEIWVTLCTSQRYCQHLHVAYVQSKAASALLGKQQRAVSHAKSHMLNRVVRCRIMKAKKATTLIASTLSPMLGLHIRVKQLNSATEVVLKVLRDRLAMSVLGYRVHQYLMHVRRVQRFYRHWVQSRKVCLTAVAMVQFNLGEVRLMRSSNVSKTDERLQLLGDVKGRQEQEGRKKTSPTAPTTKTTSPSTEEAQLGKGAEGAPDADGKIPEGADDGSAKKGTLKHRPQMGLPPPQASVVSGHRAHERGKAYAFASPHVSYLVKRKLVDMEVHKILELRRTRYCSWRRACAELRERRNSIAHQTVLAQRMLLEDGIPNTLSVEDVSDPPPPLPFCVSAARMEAMVKESFSLQAKTELSWQTSLPRSKFKALSDCLREVKAKAMHVYYRGREKEIEFLSSVDPGLANYVIWTSS